MTTANELFRDRVLLRSLLLQRFSNRQVADMIALLNSVDSLLFERLTNALINLGPESFTVHRLDAALAGVWDINEQLYRRLATKTETDMLALAESELRHGASTFEELLPRGQVRVNVPSVQQVWAAAEARPFQGRLMADWFGALGAQRRDRIEIALRTGYVQGSTVSEMITALRGTRAAGYADGLLQIDRRNAEAVVRTAISHTASVARAELYEANSDIVKAEQWVSTLDSRTTDLCMSRDGHEYSVGEHRPLDDGPPWLEGPGQIHWNCRSVSVPVIDSAKALGFELPPLERAQYSGVAAPGTTYETWLKRQPAAVQDRVLGPTRGKMLRNGEVSFTKFFNDKGQFMTLEELE